MAVEFSLTTAEAGRIIDQKLKRGVVKYTDLSTDETYALSIFNCVELGTFSSFLKDIKYEK